MSEMPAPGPGEGASGGEGAQAWPPPAAHPVPYPVWPPPPQPGQQPGWHEMYAGWQEPPRPQPRSRPASGSQRRGGVLGGLLAAVLAFLKYGLAFLKFGKFGLTLVSMAVALVAYVWIFGWLYGVGVLALIFIHESGHWLFARAEGLPVTAPVFLGPFGAFVMPKKPFSDARQEAVIAIGGPLFGLVASLALIIWGDSQDVATRSTDLLIALGYFGCFLTLFNLIPFSPLDGGRVVSAVSRWIQVAGLGLFLVVMLWMLASGRFLNPFLVIILIAGAYTTWHTFQDHRRGLAPPPLPAGTRTAIAVAYVALVVIAAVAMGSSHGALVQRGYASPS